MNQEVLLSFRVKGDTSPATEADMVKRLRYRARKVGTVLQIDEPAEYPGHPGLYYVIGTVEVNG